MKTLVKSFAFLVLLASIFACDKRHDCVPKPKNCSGKTGKTVLVTVNNAVCGYGVWGSLWLSPKDMQVCGNIDSTKQNPTNDLFWLQPYSLDAGINYTPQKGEILQITYTEAQVDNRYNNLAICMAYPGKSTPIHILCIQPVSKGSNTDSIAVTKTLKIFMSCSGTGVFGEKWLYDSSTNTYLQPCKWIGNATVPAFEEMKNGDSYEVSYTLSASKECQNNFNEGKKCFVAPPNATPIDIWTMKKAN
jgi:hypothetical protein